MTPDYEIFMDVVKRRMSVRRFRKRRSRATGATPFPFSPLGEMAVSLFMRLAGSIPGAEMQG